MVDLELVPRQRKGHHLQEIDGEHVLLGRIRAQAFFLNESASVVWKLCDGHRSVQQIVDELKAAFPDNAPDIQGDVVQTIDHLMSEGVLTVTETGADKPA